MARLIFLSLLALAADGTHKWGAAHAGHANTMELEVASPEHNSVTESATRSWKAHPAVRPSLTSAAYHAGPSRHGPVQTPQYTRGALLDVWLNNRDGDMRSLTRDRSLGQTVVEGEYFRYNQVNSDPDLRAFWGNPLLLKWSGFLEVRESGSHVFIFELAKDRMAGAMRAQTMIVLNGQTVFEANTGGSYPVSRVDSRVLPLRRGYYRLEVWLAESHRSGWTPPPDTRLGTYVKIRAPSARTPEELRPSRIWHRGS